MMGIAKRGAVVSPLLWAVALAALLLGVAYSASGTRAHAQEIEGLGDRLIFEECTYVELTVLSSDAEFTSVFWRFGPDGSLGYDSLDVGETMVLGEVPAGELVLGIVVTDTGYTYKTGPGSENPDNIPHAVVTSTRVEFEDIFGGGDFDYNDARLRLTTETCEVETAELTLSVDPEGTGFGTVSGEGTYDMDETAHPEASVSQGSHLVGWSGDCSGMAPVTDVLMDADKHCTARFDSIDNRIPPTPTPMPPVEVEGAEIGIDNMLVSNDPAYVGEEVLFQVDVSLANVPAENMAEVFYSFDADELSYTGATWGDLALEECSLMDAGVYCDFGNVAAGFSFTLHFEALMVATDSTTGAMLGADFDGEGPLTTVSAGPANANVDIIDVAGIQLPPLGDGSVVAASGGMSFQLVALLAVIAVLASTVLAARLRTGSQS